MNRITADWLTAVAPQAVMGALTGAGFQAYAVGGCVRNALLDVPVADVDIATDARPDQVIAIAKAAGLKSIPTGIDHGTVTVVSGGIGYEVTTFRADVDTDGRRATVRFSDDLIEDASRRDFTVNALYADANGNVIDPLNGLPDLAARRIRFIEDPVRRIREDYLRILRFFRFTAWYGDPTLGFDADALAAIADNLDGLAALSRERIGSELTKLLAAPDPAPAVATMAQTGVLTRLLPGASARALPLLIHAEAEIGTAPDALRRLAALGQIDGASLRLSRADQKRLTLLIDGVGNGMSPAELGYRHGFETARDILLLRAALLEQPFNGETLGPVRLAAQQRFPVRAQDLMPAFSGPELGARLSHLETLWIGSGFSLSRQDLLDQP
ncbi:CCA tRNA nucleotidyltransferase [Puniceibacterium sediminis]|uniref:Poly(A) polymerase n=1 Tax=Puniceibacterium sediminis TaxID=1608407 RepID=A0A238VQW3_9RHOB|nr:CCA tRNA nucleotidyltransferase [Puniceibacterium sediminis]SNR36752.1 poly(A) polymerase [Puniceibacterium sediminis]